MKLSNRIQEHRDAERKTAFQQFLLAGSALTVSDERVINFKTMSYEPSWLYEGGFQFKKHYFGPKPGELLEKTGGGNLAEEFECAQFLDGLPEVKFWVRNLARKVHFVSAANFHRLVLSRFPLPAQRRTGARRRIQRRASVCRGGGKACRWRGLGKPQRRQMLVRDAGRERLGKNPAKNRAVNLRNGKGVFQEKGDWV